MKKILFLAVLCGGLVLSAAAQTSFTATIKPGSTPNSVMVALLPDAAFAGKFTNVQFTLQVPNTVSSQPVVTIKSNPLSAYIPTGNYLTQITNEGGFYTYLFAATITGGATYTFQPGVELNALEVEFNNSVGPTTGRLSHLANGGSTGQLAFYVEIDGNDLTNYTAMFYGNGAVNGGAYEANSYVPLANLKLPIDWLKLDVAKRDIDAVISWTAAAEERNSHYIVERSFDTRNFTAVGTIPSLRNHRAQNDYAITDAGVGNQRKPIVYYRIKQVDVDGKVSYSKILSVRFGSQDPLLTLYPNPAKSQTVLTVDLPAEEKVSIQVMDAAGRVINNINKVFGKGYNQYTLSVANLARGQYGVSLRSITFNKTFKLIVD